nr:putative reverse transcriptase domain-containing protein [Tanacetum cinerariifolium]
MVTAPTDGKVSARSLPWCELCFTHHVGHCTIKCHKCGKVGHKIRYCKEKNVATGENALPIPTCYDCGEQGHTRNGCLRKVKQKEIREVRGRAYVIKDNELKGSNVVTSTFLLNNRYAFVLFDSGSDRSFVDTRFSFVLDIDPIKIGANYEDKEEHEKHLKIILELLKKERLYAKFSNGVYVDPAKVKAIKSWAAPMMPTKVRLFLGLAGYYRRFVKGFSLISKPLTKLT